MLIAQVQVERGVRNAVICELGLLCLCFHIFTFFHMFGAHMPTVMD